jgi:hypothetical protein
MLEQNQIYLSDSAIEGIEVGAESLQQWLKAQTGEHYSIEDLKRVVRNWLEASIESLAEDVIYHAKEGVETHAFNRREFARQLDKLTPTAEVISLPVVVTASAIAV